MLQTTDDGALSTQATESEKNQDTLANAGGGIGIDRDIKNLLSVVKSAKSKKLNFAKANSGTDFLIPKTKKAFIHLQKAFTKAPIFRHFDPKYHIRIETDVLGYAISGVLSQMISNQHFSGHVTHEDLNSEFPKSEIGQ